MVKMQINARAKAVEDGALVTNDDDDKRFSSWCVYCNCGNYKLMCGTRYCCKIRIGQSPVAFQQRRRGGGGRSVC